MPRPKRVSADEFQPHADDAKAVSELAELRARFRLDEDGRVFAVLFGRDTKDDDIGRLTGLARLTEVCVTFYGKIEPRFTDKGVEAILAFLNIQYLLCVDQPLVTNTSLAITATSPTLTRLGFPGASIDDDGVSNLASMKQLIALGLSHTTLTDRAVEHLLQLTKLEILDLLHTDITIKGMRTLVNGLHELTRFQCSRRDRTND